MITRVLSAFLVSLLLAGQVGAEELCAEVAFPVKVNFAGMIAFVEEPAKGVTWALMPDADYNQHNVDKRELPPAAQDSERFEYPPHFAALRIYGAREVVFQDKPTHKLLEGTPIYIDGTDVVMINPIDDLSSKLEYMASLPLVEKHRVKGEDRNMPIKAGQVKPAALLADVQYWSREIPVLNARFKIMEGNLTSRPVECIPRRANEVEGHSEHASETAEETSYLFTQFRPNQTKYNCSGNKPVKLAELATLTTTRTCELVLHLRMSGPETAQDRLLVAKPKDLGEGITIEVVNSIDGRDFKKEASLETNGYCEHGHLPSFRSFYWLTEKPPFMWYHRLIASAPYYAPCPASDFHAGGTRCPMLQLAPPSR
jgi:hypothetical protein